MASDGGDGVAAAPRMIDVPFPRVTGWIERYDRRHPGTAWTFSSDTVSARSPDGSSASFRVPLAPLDDLSLDGLSSHLERRSRTGLVLVRRGGFAVARLDGADMVELKIGRRHVQGKTKAGGWSQQRFARRRENQAQAAYDAASGYVHAILLPHAADLDLIVTGGDKSAVEAVFGFRALSPLLTIPRRWLPGVPDPKRAVVDQAISSARSVMIEITDTTRS